MIRIYLQYRSLILFSIVKKLCFSSVFITTSTVAVAVTNGTGTDYCINQGFKNTYYLLDYKDITAASVFFQEISLKNTSMESRLVIKKGTRARGITYFDDNNLTLLTAKKELIHVIDNNLPEFREDKEQIIFYDRTLLNESSKSFVVKNYNRKLTPFDKHPLFGRIKRKERPVLMELLSGIGISKLQSISGVININSDEEVKLITHFAIPYGAFTFSIFNLDDFGVPNTSFLLKFEMFSNEDNSLTVFEKESLNKLFCQVNKQFQISFPHAESSPWFGYAEYHKLASEILPSRTLFRKYPLLFSVGQIVCLSFIGFLFIYIVLGRYSRRDNFRKVSKSKVYL
ncbi:MAG: hypothetical protein D8M62_06400 [Proteobacteria bacterium]|nr:hypothetical protein [Pseudomonadota bacterium]